MAAEQVEVRRRLVPSEREIQLGDGGDYVFVPERPIAAPPRTSLSAILMGVLAQLNVRQVAAAGPILPLVLLGYVALVTQWDAQAFGLLLPEIKASFGFSVSFLLGFSVILYALTQLFGPLMGYVADRAKRVWMLRIGALLSHGSIFLTGLAPNIGAMIGTRALGGIGGAIGQSTVGVPLLADWYPASNRGRVVAFLGITGGIGAIAGPVVAGLLASRLGWRGALMVLGGVATLISLSLFLLREPVRGVQDRRAMGADEVAANQEQRPVSWTEGWRAASRIWTLRRLWAVTPFITVAGNIGYFTGLFYVQKYHLNPDARGAILTLNYIPGLAALAIAGPLADRILAYKPGRLMVLLAGVLLIQAIGLLVFVLTPYLWLAILVGLLPTIGASLTLPAFIVLVSLVIPARMRGLGLQTVSPFSLIGLALYPIMGHLADTQGLTYGMLALVPVLVIGALIMGSGATGVEADIRAATAAGMADEEARRARAAGRNKMLICRDVDVTYDGAQVLFHVDFDVEEGEVVALLGTNGAGKSTLLRAISGIQQASNGAIFLDGDDITHVPPHENAAKGIVMMPGGRAIFPTLTVEENLDAAAWMYRRDQGYVASKLEEVHHLFPRLRDRYHTQAGSLSGGEQQMLALAQSLLLRPRLLMIDELSLGLAPPVVDLLLEAVRRIHSQGTTIIIVEQSINVATAIAERAVYMENGAIRFDGPVRDLISRGDIVKSTFLTHAVTSDLGIGRRAIQQSTDRERVLDVSDVAISFGGVRALDGVSIAVDRGEVVGIVGHNGAGKSTLFDLVTGFETADRGSITFVGHDVTRMRPDARARLGMARSYQNVRLFPALTVRENIAAALERQLQSRSLVLAAAWSPTTRRAERRVARRVDNLIESLGLGPHAEKFVSELSTGMRRVVDIACVLGANPRLLLLDEPSSGLAQAEIEQLGPTIGRIVKETGCGMVVIEHDLGLIASTADRLVAMNLGSVIAEGTPSKVLDDKSVIESLLGGSLDGALSMPTDVRPLDQISGGVNTTWRAQ
jgi:branched-chain amino acid transport system ATP-binding protein